MDPKRNENDPITLLSSKGPGLHALASVSRAGCEVDSIAARMNREEAVQPWPDQFVAWMVAPWFAVAPLGVLLSQHVLPLIPGRIEESTAVLIESAALCTSNVEVVFGMMIVLLTLWIVITQRTLDAFRKLLFMSAAVLGMAPAVAALLGAQPKTGVFALVGVCGVLVASVGASAALSKSHTRAAGLVLAGGALTEVLRLIAWFVLSEASDSASPTLYARGVMMVNLSLAAEALALAIAVLWMSARGGRFGRIAIHTAMGAAVAIALLSQGGSALGTALRTSFFDPVAGGLPTTWTRFAQFLACASGLAAVAFVLHGMRGSRASSCIGVLLLARGATDVPMRFLFAAGASILLLEAAVNPRGMWNELLAARVKS
jgi:hypothetical protein